MFERNSDGFPSFSFCQLPLGVCLRLCTKRRQAGRKINPNLAKSRSMEALSYLVISVIPVSTMSKVRLFPRNASEHYCRPYIALLANCQMTVELRPSSDYLLSSVPLTRNVTHCVPFVLGGRLRAVHAWSFRVYMYVHEEVPY